MRLALLAAACVGVAVGCESVRPAPVPALSPPQPPVPTVEVRKPAPPVEVLRASAAAPAEPPVEDDPLVLVAQCLQRDDPRGAAGHLETYVRSHPDQLLFRLQLAELYARAACPVEARFHYERFVAGAQAGPPGVRGHVVTAHIKLMEIAQRGGDRFHELFHRGVGLLLLVKEQDASTERDEVFCEEMLCKALRALAEARDLRPGDARTRAYLAEVYDRTGNPGGARGERAAARGGVTAGGLTPTERKSVLLAE